MTDDICKVSKDHRHEWRQFFSSDVIIEGVTIIPDTPQPGGFYCIHCIKRIKGSD